MAREIIVLRLGRPGRAPWEPVVDLYRKRLRPLVTVREVTLKPVRVGDERSRIRAEAERLKAAIPSSALVIALERTGKAMSSEKFSKKIARWQGEEHGPMVLVIGSDLGLAPEFLEFSKEKWSLGPLTLPHELARVVVYEQVYRAFTILNGINYHRQPMS